MTISSKFVAFGLFIPLAMLLSACGTQTNSPALTQTGGSVTDILGSGTEITGTKTEAANVMVFMKDKAFSPATLNIKAGTTITWTNRDDTGYTISGNGVFASGPLNKGDTYSYTFDQVGNYTYTANMDAAMVGTIVVTN